MDSNEVKKKFFDVAPPKASTPGAPLVQARKSQMIQVNEPKTELSTDSSTLLAPADNAPHREMVVEVPDHSEAVQPAPVLEDEPTTTPEEETEVESDTVPTEVEPEAPIVNAVTPESPEPNAENNEPAAEAPAIEPLPETVVVEETNEPQPTQKELAEADKEIPATESFTTSDALPDSDTATAKDEMQDPKIYDTNSYHVSIKETHHGHGSAKAAFAFGAVFAVVVVAVAIYVFAKLGS